MARKKKIDKKEVLWQNKVYKHWFYKVGKTSEDKAQVCKNYGEPDEEWLESVFTNKLVTSSPHLFCKKGELE